MFGLDENHKIRNKFTFPANSLNITSIDIQSVEPVDQRTRDALQKSVQLAIEITTNSQEATARWGPFVNHSGVLGCLDGDGDENVNKQTNTSAYVALLS